MVATPVDISLLVERLLHAFGFIQYIGTNFGRVAGTLLTHICIIFAALVNLGASDLIHMSRAINTKRARNAPRQGVIVQRNSWPIAKQCNAVLGSIPINMGAYPLEGTAVFCARQPRKPLWFD